MNLYTALFRPSKALLELQERMDVIEKGWRHAEAEWVDQLDRYRRLHGRIAKRAALIEADEIKTGDDGSGGTNGGQARVGVDPISARILARRGRLGNGVL